MFSFTPARGLSNPHLQTIYGGRLRTDPQLPLHHYPLELRDGDVLDLATPTAAQTLPTTAPVVLVLHGLEGSAKSRYAQGILAACYQRGWRGIVMHQRGCGPTPNRLPRAYHALETDDLDEVWQHLNSQYPKAKKALIGYSLGGAISLNWLAKDYTKAQLSTAVAVSVPLELSAAAERVRQGFSKLYQWDFLRDMRHKVQQQQLEFPELLPDIDPSQLRDFFQYDDAITAPMHGFASVTEYYTTASPKQRLKNIQTPLLIIHAEDDPFMLPSCIPRSEDVAPNTQLLVSQHGGHVGFIAGSLRHPRYWLEETIPEYLQDYLT